MRALARQGDIEAAEASYLDMMAHQPLDDAQWSRAARSLCDVRAQRITQRLAHHDRPDGHAPTRQELKTLTQLSLSCSAYDTRHRELFERMVERTQLDIERDLKPLIRQGDYGAVLARAYDYTPYLPIEHPYAVWFTQMQSRVASHYTSLRDERFGEHLTLTAQLLDLLAHDAEEMDPPRPRRGSAARLTRVQHLVRAR